MAKPKMKAYRFDDEPPIIGRKLECFKDLKDIRDFISLMGRDKPIGHFIWEVYGEIHSYGEGRDEVTIIIESFDRLEKI